MGAMKNKFALPNYICYYILYIIICDVNLNGHPERVKENVTLLPNYFFLSSGHQP